LARSTVGYLLPLALMLAPPMGARAASPADWKDCEEGYPEDKKIAACNRILQGKKGSAADLAKATRLRGYGYSFKKDYARALNDFSEAIRLNPQDTTSFHARAWLYKERGELDKAIADYTEALRVKPSGGTYFARGQVYRQRGDEAEAVADFTASVRSYDEEIARDPASKGAFYGRSIAHRELGHFAEARSDISEHLKRVTGPNSYYLTMRAELSLAIGDVDQAIADYSELIKQNGWGDTYVQRAAAYRAKGDYKSAIRDYDKAIGELDYDADALNKRGLAYAGDGKLDRAIRDFNEAIAKYPYDDSAYYNRAQAYRLKGLLDEAIRDYGKALELNPNHAAALNSRARAFLAKGDRDHALSDLDAAINADDKFAAAYFNRGVMRQASGDLDAALADFTRAVAADPKAAEFHIARALAYAAKGAHQAALADYTSAIRIDPINATFYALRATVQTRLGRNEAARGDAHMALGRTAEAASDRASAAEARTRNEKAAQMRAAALQEADAAKRRALASARITIKGPFPVSGSGERRYTMDTVIDLRGNQIIYHTSFGGDFAVASGEKTTKPFSGTCDGREANTEGSREFSATLDGSYLQMAFSSRLSFVGGPCGGTRKAYDETFAIDLADNTCKFTFTMASKITSQAPTKTDDVKLLDQACAVEALPR